MSAPVMTYETLQEDVLSYTERSSDNELITQLPRLIMQAEDWLSRNIRGLGRLATITGALQVSNPVLAKPVRWRETASIRASIGNNLTPLRKRTLSFCQEYWPNITLTAAPKYYADYDYDRWLIAATPDAAYAIEVGYYEKPQPLSEEAQENWTTQNAPALMLKATLAEAHEFLKNYDVAASFHQAAAQAASDVLQEATRRLSDANANRVEG